MTLRRKIILLTLGFCVAIFLGFVLLFFWSWRSTITDIGEKSAAAVQEMQFSELRQTTDRYAEQLNRRLSSYQQDVALLQQYYEYVRGHPEEIGAAAVKDLYPEKEKSGLPGYGYIHPVYGAYADYEQRGEGSPWLPKRVVERARQNKDYQEAVTDELHQIMSLNHIFRLMEQKYRPTLDLVWIVLDMGATNVYPPYNYPDVIESNPEVIDLNESEEDYVSLLNPENNPERVIKWISPYFDQYRLTWMTSVIAPLYERDTFLGTMGMDILLSTLSEEVTNFPVGREGYAFLLDNDGKVIAMPSKGVAELIADETYRTALAEMIKPREDQKWNDDLFAALEADTLEQKVFPDLATVLSRIKSDPSGSEEVALKDEMRVVSWAPVTSADWRLVLVVPRQDWLLFTQGLGNVVETFFAVMAQRFGIVLIFGFALIVLVVWVAYHSIVRPILRITNRFRRYDTSEIMMIDANLTKRRDEIGSMCRAFNDMATRLGKVGEEKERKIARTNKMLAVVVPTLKRIALGDFNQPITVPQSEDEFTELLVALNLMAEDLRESTIDLEGKITRKTRELTFRVKELEGTREALLSVSEELSRKSQDSVRRVKELEDTRAALLNIAEDANQKSAELAATNSKNEALLASIGDAVYAVNLDKKIILFNLVAEKITGWSASEAIGKNCYDVMRLTDERGQKNLCRSLCPLDKAWKTNRPMPLANDIFCMTKTGATVPIADSAAAIKDIRGRAIGGIVVFRDVTKEKEIDKAKTDFVTLVSHELRTPLAITMEGIDLLTEGIVGQPTVKQKDILLAGQRNLRRLAAIVRDMLDMAKIEAGKFEMHCQMTDVCELIKKAAVFFQNKAARKGLPLKIAVPKSIKAYADPEKVSQILTNLVDNSLKFTHTGYIEIGATDLGEEIQCYVFDTGMGIAKQDLPLAFNKFQQFEHPISPGEKGTGLGLSLCRAIVTAHHGKIWIESEKGKWTKVTFSLPKKQNKKPEA